MKLNSYLLKASIVGAAVWFRYAVSSPIYDRLLGTGPTASRFRLPVGHRAAPTWLGWKCLGGRNALRLMVCLYSTWACPLRLERPASANFRFIGGLVGLAPVYCGAAPIHRRRHRERFSQRGAGNLC